MTRSKIETGTVIDGFTIGEQVHSGGMATLWSVTHPDIPVPLLMKIPRVAEGEDPAAIVSFEMEQMILPRLSGPHLPQCSGTGDFAHQAYVVLERIPGETLYKRLKELPLPYEKARVLATLPSARLACLNVLKLNRLAVDRTLDEEGRNKHIDRMVSLRHWAQPLELDEGRLTVHVLEAYDPADAILEFARTNQVDHIVLGARQNSLTRSLLGSVSAEIAGQAPCTVTVVRPPRRAGEVESRAAQPVS